MSNIVLIDICGTLYFSNTTFDFLDYYLTSSKYKRFRKLSKRTIVKIFNIICMKVFKWDCIRWKAVRFLKGIPKEELIREARLFYEDKLAYQQNMAVFELLKQISPEKKRILISATLDFIASVIAEKTGIMNFFPSELVYDHHGICQGKIHSDLLGNKLKLIKKHGLEHQYDIVLTDNYSDRYLFNDKTLNYVVSGLKQKKRWIDFASRRHLNLIFIDISN